MSGCSRLTLAPLWVLIDCLSALLRSLPTCSRALLLAGFVEGRPLSNAVVMALPDHIRIRRKRQKTFDGLSASYERVYRTVRTRCLPDLNVSATVVPRPDTQDVFSTTDTKDSSAN